MPKKRETRSQDAPGTPVFIIEEDLSLMIEGGLLETPETKPAPGSPAPESAAIQSPEPQGASSISVPEPPSPAPLVVQDTVQEIKTLLEGQDQAIQGLARQFSEQIATNQHAEKMFSALYAELKSYKDTALQEAFYKHIIKDLILFYDDLSAIENQGTALLNEQKEAIPVLCQWIKNLSNTKSQLLEILYRMDVVPFTEKKERLDRTLHRVVRIVPTSSKEEDGRISEVLRTGFHWGTRIIRPEEVIVLQYQAGS